MAKEVQVNETKRNGGAVSPFDVLQSRIDRLFEDFGRGFRFPDLLRDDDFFAPLKAEGILPSMDVHDADGTVKITAELPGVDEKDINISVADDVLTISGEKKSEVKRKEGDRYRSERTYGSFSRSVGLGFNIDPEKVEARFDKGVLTLSVPKPAESARKTRKIEIKH